MGMTDDLIKLAELKERGVLSEEEFAKAKAQILGLGPTQNAPEPVPAPTARPTAPTPPSAPPVVPRPSPPPPIPTSPKPEESTDEQKARREAERLRAAEAQAAQAARDRLSKITGISLAAGFLIVIAMIVMYMAMNP
jgi:hypothetical protein